MRMRMRRGSGRRSSVDLGACLPVTRVEVVQFVHRLGCGWFVNRHGP